MSAVLDEIFFYFNRGGWVMAPLSVGACVLWFAIGCRWVVLKRGFRGGIEQTLKDLRAGNRQLGTGILSHALLRFEELRNEDNPNPLADRIREASGELEADLQLGKTWIHMVTITAPLAGLLGTVGGMIETFDSMREMSLFTQSGGIAGGISQALFTTQMGLAVAIPGLLAGRALNRTESALRLELERAEILALQLEGKEGTS